MTEFVGEGGHPVVRQDRLEWLPHDHGRVFPITDRDKHIGAVYREAFPTDAAWTEYDDATVRIPVEADGGDDGLVESMGCAEGFRLVADLNSWIDGSGCSAGQDAAVGQDHGRGAVFAAVGVPSVDKGLAGSDGSGESGLIHADRLRRRLEPFDAFALEGTIVDDVDPVAGRDLAGR